METVRSRTMPWRSIGWGGAALLLIAPMVAMQFTREVAWSAGDFIVFGVMLLAAGLAIELATRTIAAGRTRVLAIIAVLAGFVAVWALLAVGLD